MLQSGSVNQVNEMSVYCHVTFSLMGQKKYSSFEDGCISRFPAGFNSSLNSFQLFDCSYLSQQYGRERCRCNIRLTIDIGSCSIFAVINHCIETIST